MPISPPNTDEILIDQKDRVLVITLNRPERLNAISRDMLNELSAKVVDDCFNSEDYEEGRRAFMEKRKPVFQGQ